MPFSWEHCKIASSRGMLRVQQGYNEEPNYQYGGGGGEGGRGGRVWSVVLCPYTRDGVPDDPKCTYITCTEGHLSPLTF